MRRAGVLFTMVGTACLLVAGAEAGWWALLATAGTVLLIAASSLPDAREPGREGLPPARMRVAGPRKRVQTRVRAVGAVQTPPLTILQDGDEREYVGLCAALPLEREPGVYENALCGKPLGHAGPHSWEPRDD